MTGQPKPSAPDEPDDTPPDPGVARLATLGELLEAHHSRFVERVRERERKEQGQ